jgi:hypothetical protein
MEFWNCFSLGATPMLEAALACGSMVLSVLMYSVFRATARKTLYKLG